MGGWMDGWMRWETEQYQLSRAPDPRTQNEVYELFVLLYNIVGLCYFWISPNVVRRQSESQPDCERSQAHQIATRLLQIAHKQAIHCEVELHVAIYPAACIISPVVILSLESKAARTCPCCALSATEPTDHTGLRHHVRT